MPRKAKWLPTALAELKRIEQEPGKLGYLCNYKHFEQLCQRKREALWRQPKFREQFMAVQKKIREVRRNDPQRQVRETKRNAERQVGNRDTQIADLKVQVNALRLSLHRLTELLEEHHIDPAPALAGITDLPVEEQQHA